MMLYDTINVLPREVHMMYLCHLEIPGMVLSGSVKPPLEFKWT